MGTQAGQGEHEHTQAAFRDLKNELSPSGMKVKFDTWTRVKNGFAGDLFHTKTHPTSSLFRKTQNTSPFSAERLSSSTTKKMDPTITHVARSGDIHRFTVAHPASRMLSHAVATSPCGVSSWVHFGATAMGPLWVSCEPLGSETSSWHFSNQNTGFDHQQ